jgi:hypothetical protein
MVTTVTSVLGVMVLVVVAGRRRLAGCRLWRFSPDVRGE